MASSNTLKCEFVIVNSPARELLGSRGQHEVRQAKVVSRSYIHPLARTYTVTQEFEETLNGGTSRTRGTLAEIQMNSQ